MGEPLHHPWKVTPGVHHFALARTQPASYTDLAHLLPYTDLLLLSDLENVKFFLHLVSSTALRGDFAGQSSSEMGGPFWMNELSLGEGMPLIF